MASKIKLGELLVRAGVLDESRLKAALTEQKRWGGRLGRILVDMGYVSEDLLVKALSKQLGVARATFQNFNVPTEISAKIGHEFMNKHALCPERFDPATKVLTVAMADPTNVAAVDELRFKTGLKVEAALIGERQLTVAMERYIEPLHGTPGVDLEPSLIRAAIEEGGQTYQAAMAASGIPVDPRTPPGTLPTPTAAPAPPPPAAAAGIERAGDALTLAGRLDDAQKQQQKAIRALLELLLEKGVFTREEYVELVSKR